MMKFVTGNRRLLLIGATAMVGCAGAVAAAATQGGPIAYTARAQQQAGGPPEQVLTDALARYGGDRVVSARLVAAPATAGARAGRAVAFRVKVPSEGAGVVRSAWEADLLQGVVADAAAGSEPIVASMIEAVLPGGRIIELTGGMGDISPAQSFDAPSNAAVQRDIRVALGAAGLRVVVVTIMHAGQPAPAVVAEAVDPRAAAAGAAAAVQSLFGSDPPRYEGYYFEVRDTEGNPLFVQSASFRTGAGRLWVSPSVQDVVSLAHG